MLRSQSSFLNCQRSMQDWFRLPCVSQLTVAASQIVQHRGCFRMIGSQLIHEDRRRSKVERLCSFRPLLTSQTLREIVERNRYIRVCRTKRLLLNSEGSPIQQLGFRVLRLVGVKTSQ